MPALRDLVSEYAPGEEEEFARWAFGEDYLEFSGRMVFLDAWNGLHGDKLMLSGDGCPAQDIPKMIDVWKECKQLP